MSERISPMDRNAFLKIDADGCITVHGWCFDGHTGSHREAVLRLVLWALGKAYDHQDQEPSIYHEEAEGLADGGEQGTAKP